MELKVKWYVYPRFAITVHKKDRGILEKIQSSLGCKSHIVTAGSDYVSFQIVGVKNLQVLIAHLDKFSLITKKFIDYTIFKSIVELISKKEHLNEAGLRKIVEHKASLNRGLSPELKAVWQG